MPAAEKKQSPQKTRANLPGAPADILTAELRDIYSAENQLTRALPRLSKALETASVKELAERRLDRARTLVEDLDDLFEGMELTPGRKKNVAAEGRIADALERAQEL